MSIRKILFILTLNVRTLALIVLVLSLRDHVPVGSVVGSFGSFRSTYFSSVLKHFVYRHFLQTHVGALNHSSLSFWALTAWSCSNSLLPS